MQAGNHDANAVSDQESLHKTLRKSVYVLLLAAFVLSGSVIIASDVLFPSGAKVALEVGDVSPHDILAPRSLKYESEVLSQAKRDAEIAAVRPIYDPPDPSVKSEQLQRARQILEGRPGIGLRSGRREAARRRRRLRFLPPCDILVQASPDVGEMPVEAAQRLLEARAAIFARQPRKPRFQFRQRATDRPGVGGRPFAELAFQTALGERGDRPPDRLFFPGLFVRAFMPGIGRAPTFARL